MSESKEKSKIYIYPPHKNINECLRNLGTRISQFIQNKSVENLEEVRKGILKSYATCAEGGRQKVQCTHEANGVYYCLLDRCFLCGESHSITIEKEAESLEIYCPVNNMNYILSVDHE